MVGHAGETSALLPRGGDGSSVEVRADSRDGRDDAPVAFQSCYPNKRYRRWVLLLLFLIATLQTTDRNIPAILLPKIGPEFHMTDADAGMLNGAAFVLIYALATIPLARLADMCGRKYLLAGSLVVWSTLTSLSGLSQNTTQLCFLRVGIGLGEAGCTPAAQSLIAVMYGPGERASAMAVQQLGLAAGTAAANLLGGLLVDSLGWRGVFGVMGVPGFVLAGLLLLTLEDPPTQGLGKYGGGDASGSGDERGRESEAEAEVSSGGPPGDDAKPPSSAKGKGSRASSWSRVIRDGSFWSDLWAGIYECATHLGRKPSFIHLSIGVMIQVGVGLSIMAFLPIFLVRVHGMTTKDAGVQIAEIGGVFGGAGIVLGGVVGDYLVRKSGDQRWMLWFILGCNVVAAPLMVAATLVESTETSVVISSAVVALFMVMVGPPGAIVQSLVPDRMRATAAGFFGVVANLVGGSLGPLAIGYLSDALRGRYGRESIRYALAYSMLFCVWGQVHWYFAGRAMPGDVLETAVVTDEEGREDDEDEGKGEETRRAYGAVAV
jgi:MFS family permease